jgi:hypothetical protein
MYKHCGISEARNLIRRAARAARNPLGDASRRRLAICMMGLTAMAFVGISSAETVPSPNYDESKVPQYRLPDPLVGADGQAVTSPDAWREKRRPEVLKLFEQYVYGKAPGRPQGVACEVRSVDADALGGKAVRKEVTIHLAAKGKTPKIDVVIFLPKGSKRPAPVFLGLNFDGNHTIHPDPGIRPSDVRALKSQEPGTPGSEMVAKARGSSYRRWPLEQILARGYGVATAWYGDIEPDFAGGMRFGVRQLYVRLDRPAPADDAWGAIGAWAWGLSRIMDYLETDADIDARRVALIGHSRLGKTALWAGAQDERFALVISNNSGCGGASLARRQYGETPARITTSFPHWFCGNYRKYAFRVGDLPVDQHLLMALIAPRPLYVASAEEDRWADPRGEFLSAKGADPVYRLLGTDGLPAAEMPAVGQPISGAISYHIRRGKHDVTEYDWQRYMDCADRHLKGR